MEFSDMLYDMIKKMMRCQFVRQANKIDSGSPKKTVVHTDCITFLIGVIENQAVQTGTPIGGKIIGGGWTGGGWTGGG